jgi:FtsP/CotA-like multicopper oxidase with cupredoxin domain
VTPTRRIVLGGGLAAALWRLGAPARADAADSAAGGVLNLEAAPARLQLAPAPAEPAAAYAYAGAIPGPLIRLKQGEELKLRLSNKLAEPTTLSFPGLRAANAAAGIGGLTQERIKPGASAEIRFVPPDSGFNLYLPRAGSTDASQQGRGLFGPIIVDEPKAPDVDVDAAVLLSDWNVDASGQIKDDFADPAIGRGSGRKGDVVFANEAASGQRCDRASGDGRDKRRKNPHRGRRQPAVRAIRTPRQPVTDGPGRPVRIDVRHAA